MKINSVNSIGTFSRPGGASMSFKHTAVPYPEYYDAYIFTAQEDKNIFGRLADKISDLFNPKVSKEAEEIKSKINTIFDKSALDKPELVLLA